MLASVDDLKEALDKAANSADPAVRNMALEYQELRQKFTRCEVFFEIYKEGSRFTGVPVRPVVRGRIPASRPVLVPSRPQTSKADGFSLAMQGILLDAGRPMKLDDLFTVYLQQHPDDQPPKETFRQRLVKRRDVISLVKGQGYWWAAAEVPNGAEAVEAAESA